ncbi:APC family permease [Lachnospiraceae bacterium ZAX-1]
MNVSKKKKKFSLFSAILSVICVVFVAEAAAPVAAIGNSQFFWWIFLMLVFLLPCGLISSELGTAYLGNGGIYDWTTKAFGHRWGTRVAWYYWINFPLWMASLAVMCPEILGIALGHEIDALPSLLIGLLFIWIIVFISFYPASDNIWILNGAAIIKVFLAVLVGVFGVYVAFTKGVANEYTLSSLLPSLDLNSLSFISVILFNFLGLEIVCTFASEMENPQKQIPQSIIVGGIAISAIYIFSAFGIGVAIPTEEISTSSGLIDSIRLMSGKPQGLFLTIIAILFLLTLFGNVISWSLGINRTACYAAQNGDMPKFFGKKRKNNGMPIGSALMNGIVASIIVATAPLLPNQHLFWAFFALNLVMHLLSNLPVFLAFLKLRKSDLDTVRPFRVGGKNWFLHLLVALPMLIIIISIIFIAIPFDSDPATLSDVLPITIGSIVCIAIGEIMIKVKKIKP